MGRGLNLIPAPLLQERRERRRARWGLRATALYLSLLLAGTMGYLTLVTPRSADGAAAEAAVSAQQVSLLQQQVADVRRDLAEAHRRLQGGRVLSERPDWSALLQLVAASAGEDVVLGDLSLNTTGPTADAGATIRLGGIARDPWTVSTFVLRLEDSGLFDRVTIVSSGREPYRQTTATAFTLRCDLHGGHPPAPEDR